MAHLGLSPRQSMGQNFLVQQEVARQIVAAAGVPSGQNVLEVGPGLGALTWALREAGARVVAVEKDRGLAAFLANQYQADPGVRVVESDILRWDLESLGAEGGDWMAIANLPYNVAVPILFRLLEAPVAFRALYVMLQREVAERMAARAGDPTYGVLSIRLALAARVESVLEVAPDAFYPSPKVRSMVVKVTPGAAQEYDTGPRDTFDRLVKAAFGKRRKMLRNALAAASLELDLVDAILARAGIDGRRRGETLTIDEFCRLNRAFVQCR